VNSGETKKSSEPNKNRGKKISLINIFQKNGKKFFKKSPEQKFFGI